MIFSRNVDGLRFQVACDEDLQPQAQALLSAVAEMHKVGPALSSGSLIHYGWVRLRLASCDGGLWVCEPDFFKQSIEQYIPRVDYTLGVISEQAHLIQRLGCSSKVTHFSDSLVISNGCLAQHRIYLERRQAVTENDSGWYIGSQDQVQEKAQLSSIQAYQLLKLRPELMPVLALPVGYIATFAGERLEAILDDQDNAVWRREGANSS
jgi:hypothetical protein